MYEDKLNRCRILYVGSLWPGSTAKMRADTLKELGQDISLVDTFYEGSCSAARTLVYKISNRLGYPVDRKNINRKVLGAASEVSYDILWIDDIRIISAKTLRLIHKKSPHTKIVCLIMDNPFSSKVISWRRFLNAVPFYDIHFVIQNEHIDKLQKLGASNVRRYHKGFYEQIHRPYPELLENPSCDVFFAGHWESKREADIAFLIKNGMSVKVCGHKDWKKSSNWHLIEPVFINGGVYGEDYPRALCSAKINLCFYSQWNKDVENSRMYEIPACGAFMLAERNQENVNIFEEGIDAVFFSSQKELLEKVRYYLENNHERNSIASKGRVRCVTSRYDYKSRIMSLLQIISNMENTL